MQKSILLLTLLLIIHYAKAQYYYNDIVDLKSSNNVYANLIQNNVRGISATSTESDNTPTTGFIYSKIIKNNGTAALTHTELETGGISDDFDYYTNGQLTKSVDSSDNVLTTVEYTYDSLGKISTVQTQTDDTAMNMHDVELHEWFYFGGVPDSMIRIKDKKDTTIVRFRKDNSRNITEEIWLKKGKQVEHYYYYYNNKSELTDIVRFNTRAQQMLPDFLFEYDESGRLSQLTQIPQGSSEYVIWKYEYDERGLKIKDILFDKHRELMATVVYSYR